MENTENKQKFFKISEVAADFGVNSATIKNWAKEGYTKIFKVGTTYFMSLEEREKLTSMDEDQEIN